MLRTTAGQLALNSVLPPDLIDYQRRLDKKGLEKLLQEVAVRYPEKYAEIAKHLADVGRQVAYHAGGYSFGLQHLLPTITAQRLRQQLHQQIQAIHQRSDLSEDAKEQQVVQLLQQAARPLEEANYRENLEQHNPLALQVLSGARGSPTNLKSLTAGDLLYEDHRNRLIPVPVLHSYAEGLRPAEYYGASFGARKGVIDVKKGVQDSGFVGKMFVQAAHRLVVLPGDRHEEPGLPRGLPVPVEDPDNEGSLLAHAAGGFKLNTILTPHILADLRRQGIQRILVRSPAVGGHHSGGLYARDAGVRETGSLAAPGTFVGIPAVQSLAEPLSQGSLSSKHQGGVAGAAKAVSGFQAINQLIQIPSSFQGAAHAQKDGRITAIHPAPQGGLYVSVDGDDHHVAQGLQPAVKVGDTVEAGDLLSEGAPNPAEIVKHKHLGEGRRAFTYALRQAFHDAGLPAHRRNIEVLARGLIDHVRLTDELGPWAPDDIVPYTRLEHHWQPRHDAVLHPPRRAVGMHLEKPVLHFTLGTKIKPSTVKELEHFGIRHVLVHSQPPPFEPVMVRGLETLTKDPDWMVRFLGSYLERGLLHGAQRGDVADELGTSYVPALARGTSFGLQGLTAPSG